MREKIQHIFRWIRVRARCKETRGLSLKARLAIGLHLFQGYCQRRALADPEISALVDYLWGFLGISSSAEFDRWATAQEPALLAPASCPDEPLPRSFREVLSKHGVRPSEFRKMITNLVEIILDNLGCKPSEAASRACLTQVARIADRHDVAWPSLSAFEESRWSDGGGWGRAEIPADLAAWRKL